MKVLPPTTNWVTVSVGLSTSVSLASTLPVAAVSSLIVTLSFTPTGASFTEVTLKLIVFATGSVSTPPFAVPPSSLTWKVKTPRPAPLPLAGGV